MLLQCIGHGQPSSHCVQNMSQTSTTNKNWHEIGASRDGEFCDLGFGVRTFLRNIFCHPTKLRDVKSKKTIT